MLNIKMDYQQILPSESMRKYVRCFWVFEGIASKDNPYIHRTLANGFPELLFHYRGTFEEIKPDKFEKSFITGIHGHSNQFSRFIIKENFGIFGVQLYPYALSALFGLPAIEFTNEQPHLLSLNIETEIEEKMLSATDNTERLQIITTFLENKLHNYPSAELIHIVKEIINKKGVVNVKELSGQCYCNR